MFSFLRRTMHAISLWLSRRETLVYESLQLYWPLYFRFWLGSGPCASEKTCTAHHPCLGKGP